MIMTKRKSLFAVATVLAMGAGTAQADMSANIGYMSDYIYRGFYVSESAPMGGFDYENENGFYIGTWGADVDSGLEYDIYFGYGGGNDDYGWSVGFTGYYYTDKADDTYEEINLGISSGIFALDVALGEYDAFGFPVDYTYYAVTISPEVGPYFLIGNTEYEDFFGGPDADGTWFEIGKGFEVADGLEVAVSLLYSSDAVKPGSSLLLSPSGDDEYALTMSITKSISIGD
jgi:hypothetical protein